uniref:Uncharacterized protein n=1 Tax=Glossina austeni TaxID=7395 RepID=A0A1A9V3M6_GLOAU
MGKQPIGLDMFSSLRVKFGTSSTAFACIARSPTLPLQIYVYKPRKCNNLKKISENFNFYFCFEVFYSLLQASNKRANVVARPDNLTDVLTAWLDECLKIQLKVLAFCNFPCLRYSSKQANPFSFIFFCLKQNNRKKKTYFCAQTNFTKWKTVN